MISRRIFAIECDVLNPPTLETSKGFENISKLRSGTFLEAHGYARAERCIIRLLELTVFQGFYTLFGLCPGMDPRLPNYMRVIERFLVSSRPREITGVTVRTTVLAARLEILQPLKWYFHASQEVCNDAQEIH